MVLNAWPDAIVLSDVNKVDDAMIRDILRTKPFVSKGLVVGGPPCQPFTGLNPGRAGFADPRAGGIAGFVQLVRMLRDSFPQIEWHSLMENVASMSRVDRGAITAALNQGWDQLPRYWFDAATIGPISRPRRFWLSWGPAPGPLGELEYDDVPAPRADGYIRVCNASNARIPVKEFLDP